MPRTRKPRKGSLQYWPRKRAKRIYARVRSWLKQKNTALQGFAGYKAGMTHIQFLDNISTSPTKGSIVTFPATIIECPPLKCLGVNFYSSSIYGLKLSTFLFSPNLDKELKRKISLPKNYNYEERLKKIKENISNYDEVRLVVYTQPKSTTIGKKKPDIFEINIAGENTEEKLNFALEKINREIKINEVFKQGQLVDIHAITKGKGFQGAIKRFGISLKSHKSEKKRRAPGNVGPWRPSRISWTVPMPGQMGFHTRTEYNKEILLIGEDPKKINPKSGLNRYGEIRNQFILVKGSVPGSKKRLIRLVSSIRNSKARPELEINYIKK